MGQLNYVNQYSYPKMREKANRKVKLREQDYGGKIQVYVHGPRSEEG